MELAQREAMEVIPVIDLKGGTVVRARMGDRDNYRPIETPLSSTSTPLDVVRGLLAVYPFTTLYIADLDAIERKGDNRAALVRLQEAFPALALWVDNGMGDFHAAQTWLASGLGHLVLGSESQRDAGLVHRFADDARIVLSLDFRGEAFQGPPALREDAGCWPRRVIVMTLARVGSASGPDLPRLQAIRDVAPDREIYAAGGVRDANDLVALTDAGIAGALVASCLHDGTLGRTDMERLQEHRREQGTWIERRR